MSDNLHTIFSGSECPPHSLLMDYFLRKLPEEEMHWIEEHLVDCEMCSDELEGLSKMNDPRDLDAIVEEINERVVAGKRRILGLRSNYALLAAAALIVILAGSVAVVRIMTRVRTERMMSAVVKPSVTMPEVVTPSAPPPPQAEPAREKKAERPGTAIRVPQTRSDNVPVVEEMELPVAGLASADISRPETAVTTIPAETKPLAYQKPVTDTVSVTAEAANYSMRAAKAADEKQAKESSGIRYGGKVETTSLMDIAMEEFNAGNYTRAATFFEQVVANQPGNNKAAYHLAYSFYMEKRFKKASKALEPVLKDAGNECYPEALILDEKIKSGKDR